jgi:hypothetical protein
MEWSEQKLAERFEIFIKQKRKGIQKLNLHHWKENLKKMFVSCERSDVTPAMVTMSATVNMAVKWRLNLRKHFVCSSTSPQNL